MRPDKHYELEPGGNFFDPTRREAVVGSFVAQKMGLKPGDTFHPYHGLIFNERDQHSETYVVVGVLKPSNTPSRPGDLDSAGRHPKNEGPRSKGGDGCQRGAGEIERGRRGRVSHGHDV